MWPGSATDLARQAANEAHTVTQGVRAHRLHSPPSLLGRNERVALSPSRFLIGGAREVSKRENPFLIQPPAASTHRKRAWAAAVLLPQPHSQCRIKTHASLPRHEIVFATARKPTRDSQANISDTNAGCQSQQTFSGISIDTYKILAGPQATADPRLLYSACEATFMCHSW